MHMTLLYLSHYENVKVKIFNLVNDISKIYLSSQLAITLPTHREYLCVVFWQITSHRILKVDTPTKYEVGTSRKEKHKHKCLGSSICYATSLGGSFINFFVESSRKLLDLQPSHEKPTLPFMIEISKQHSLKFTVIFFWDLNHHRRKSRHKKFIDGQCLIFWFFFLQINLEFTV